MQWRDFYYKKAIERLLLLESNGNYFSIEILWKIGGKKNRLILTAFHLVLGYVMPKVKELCSLYL